MSIALMRLAAVLALGLMIVGGCSRPSPPKNLSGLLQQHRGQVLVLLLGREGCPGTANATAALEEYLATRPERVSVVRLDVPLPNEELKLTTEWKRSFPRYLDAGRKIAGELEFFYYPTLYVFDPQGEKRYVGGCDKERVAEMTREILAEKPGDAKNVYTLRLPEVGEPAPALAGGTIEGKAVTKDSLAGKRGLLVIFARTSCQFSAKEIPQFRELANRLRGEGVVVVVVNQGENLSTIKPIYDSKCAGVPVVWDREGAICESFGVDAVPFFFLLDGDGDVAGRRSFTHTAAVNSVNAMLGRKAEKSRFKPTEGG